MQRFDDRKPKLFILTGNMTEFNHYYPFCKDNYNVFYVHDEEVIRGNHGGFYICLGNWHRKKDVHHILAFLVASECKEVFASDVSQAFFEEQERDQLARIKYENEYKQIEHENIRTRHGYDVRVRKNRRIKTKNGNVWKINPVLDYGYGERETKVYEFIAEEEMNL